MNNLFTSLCSGSLALLTLTAQAQVRFSIGPKVGLNIATTRFAPDERFVSYGAVTTSITSYRPGFEAGVLGSLGFGHFLVQPAVLYSQKGFHVRGTQSNVMGTDGTIPAPYEQANRMNYLTLPLNLAYAQHKDGQGFQLSAGAYLGILVGDRFTRPSTALVVDQSGAIKGGKRPADFNGFTDRVLYSQRVDAGLQAGLGYQWGHALLQASYSVGLRNLAPDDYDTYSFLGNGPDYSNRVFQLSLAYLMGLKR